jgi:hypothetical protein
MGCGRSEYQSLDCDLCLRQPISLNKSYQLAHTFHPQAILFRRVVFELIAQLDIPGQRIFELFTGPGVCCYWI